MIMSINSKGEVEVSIFACWFNWIKYIFTIFVHEPAKFYTFLFKRTCKSLTEVGQCF